MKTKAKEVQIPPVHGPKAKGRSVKKRGFTKKTEKPPASERNAGGKNGQPPWGGHMAGGGGGRRSWRNDRMDGKKKTEGDSALKLVEESVHRKGQWT